MACGNARQRIDLKNGEILDVGDIADGEMLVRDGDELVGQAVPGGGSTPTGTGFRHVTSGAEDAAAKLVENADVHASAAIASSKLADGANIPSSGEKSALAGTSGTPGAGNKYVTAADAVNTNARTPDITGQTAETVTDRESDLMAFYDASAGAVRKAKLSDLASGVIERNATHVDVGPSDASEISIFSKSILANTLGSDRMLRLSIRGTAKNQSGSGRAFQIRVKFGGTTLLDFNLALASSATLTTFHLAVEIQNDGATNAQHVTAVFCLPIGSAPATGTAGGLVQAGGTRTVEGTGSIDTTANRTFEVTLQLPISDANLYADIERGILELI